MDPAVARARMVEEQLVARGVSDARVLAAMRSVERHRFVPEAAKDDAYADRPLPIGEGQTISQPYMVAIMTEVLDVAPHHHVLEIGTGSGYQTAVLTCLGRDVVSIERHPSLASSAREALASAGFTRVEVIVGDGSVGYLPRGPYDRILVTAGAPAVPAGLKAQLAQHGRLVIPVGPPGLQRVTIVTRLGNTFSTEEGDACVFVPLVGRDGWAGDGEPPR